MQQAKSIGFEFKKIADLCGEKPAIIAEDITVSYEKLWKITEVFAYKMRENGVNQNSVIGVNTTDMIVSLASMLASSLLGAQYVTPDIAIIKSGIVNMTHCFRSPDTKGIPGLNYIIMDQTWAPVFAPANLHIEDKLQLVDPSHPWWILSTSGTTGTPKILRLSQAVVFDRSMAVRKDFIADKTVFCSLFLCHTRPFFVRGIAALLNACTIVDSQNFEFWEKTGVNFVCGSPFLAVDLLGEKTLQSKIPLLQVSGAKITAASVKRLLNNFAIVEDVYGSSETNKSFVNSNILDQHGALLSRGKSLDSEVQIVNENGEPCEEGHIGIVRIKNPYMADGYVNDPDASKRSFRDGWFYPGDIGKWGPNGSLEILRRVDDVINIGGDKISPAVIEETLMQDPMVRQAACFQNPDPKKTNVLMAFLVLESGSQRDQVVNRVHELCLRTHGITSTPQDILVVDEIPIDVDGAPRRDECRKIASELLRI